MKNIIETIKNNILFGMLISIIIVIVVTVQVFDFMVTNQQDDEIDKLSSFITYSINNSVGAEDLIQSYLIQILESTTYQIEAEIGNRDLSNFTLEDLEEIKERYKLSGVALFKKEDEDIIIEKSTSEHEVGLSTKTWGFWHEAFSQLLNDEEVSIGRGVSIGKFWAGPRSLAYGQDGYYIFTYYKIENQPYLLNIYVDDMNAFGLVKKNDPNKLVKQMIQETDFIDEIAVINVDAWNNRFLQENRSKLQDFTVEYGRYTSFTAEDTYYLNKVNKLIDESKIKKEVVYEGQKYTKIYKKLKDDQVAIFLVNNINKALVKRQIIWIILSGLILICVLGFSMVFIYTKKYTDLLKIERSRLKIAEEYRHTVQILPSIVLRVKKNKDEFIVKHCEGKGLLELGINRYKAQNSLLEDVLPKSYYEIVTQGINHALEGQEHSFEYAYKGKVYENKIQPILDKDEIDEIIIFANDITRLRKSENRAKYLAYHDSLTSLPNRLYLKEKVESLIEKRSTKFIVCFIDLDGFKYINDTSGHDIGDELLIQVSRRISQLANENDFLARIGGDEFAFIFMDIENESEIKEKVKKLTSLIGMQYTIEGIEYKITSSIGISRFPEDADSYTELIKKADLAMYKVKDNGKDGFNIFSEK